MNFNPTRRVLLLPAWSWLVVSAVLIGLANALPMPTEIEEPNYAAAIFEQPVFITRDGDDYRVVQRDAARETIPVWAVGRSVTKRFSVERYADLGVLPGFYLLSGHWEYTLHVSHFGKHWEPDEQHPARLASTDVEQIQPLVVAELNQRSADGNLGDRFTDVLQNGSDRATWLVYQNLLSGLAWLSVLMAIVAVLCMFRPDSASDDVVDTESDQA